MQILNVSSHARRLAVGGKKVGSDADCMRNGGNILKSDGVDFLAPAKLGW